MQDQQPAPDFGEPWQADKTWPQIICDKGGVHAMVDVFDKTPGLRDRIIATMNACAGMVDPAAEIQAMRLAAPVWQPIETAPKDGLHILAHDGNTYYPPAVVHWHVDDWYLSNCPIDGNNEYDPAHWMPLPTPPQV